jgi:hypothetical protein
VSDLTDAIVAYIGEHNADPKPFVWTATAASIHFVFMCFRFAMLLTSYF